MLKLGMSVPDNKNVTHLLKVIKEAGFQCIMATYLTDDEPIDEILREAEKNALSISSLHAPIANINSFWQNGGEGDDYLEFIKKRVDFCREHDIRIMVAHTTFGNIIPAVSEIGFERFARLNDYAEEKGVCICYEKALWSVFPHFTAFAGISATIWPMLPFVILMLSLRASLNMFTFTIISAFKNRDKQGLTCTLCPLPAISTGSGTPIN